MTEDKIHLGINVGRNDLRELPELGSYGTNYLTVAPHVSYERIFLDASEFRFLEAGGLITEASVSHVSGDEGNRDSQRDHLELRVGWRQRFPFHLYLEPQIGTGLGGDKLNFGGGLEPEWKFGLAWQVQGTAGLEFCFDNDFCLAGEAGYFYERNVIGHPYQNSGILAGLSTSWDLL